MAVPISLIISAAVLVNGLSSLAASSAPRLALRFNPLLADARVTEVVEQLQSQNESETLKPFIRTGLELAPLDARFYSLLGIAEERSGNQDVAERLYSRALTLLPTEIHALTRMAFLDVLQTRPVDAAKRLEIIARRWPNRWKTVEPLLPAILSDPQAYALLVDRFATEKSLRNFLIASLIQQKEWMASAYTVLLEWHERGVPELADLINRLTTAFIGQQLYANAYLLFLLTRGQDTGAEVGYIYNGGFQLPLSGNPFDWRIRPQTGVSFELNTLANIAGESLASTPEQSLSIRFLDTPIQFNNIEQLIRLAPGKYNFTVDYSALDLKTPKPLQLVMRCVGDNRSLASMSFEQGSIEERTDSIPVQVPTQDCALQRILVFNAQMAMSWRNRYSGTLRLKQVAVTRAVD